MVEVLIEEMFRSDRSRPLDYKRAVVVDAEVKDERTKENTLQSERRESAQKVFDRADIVRDVR